MKRLSHCIISIIFLLFSLLLVNVAAYYKRSDRIVGGRVVNETQAGWHVGIIHKRILVCSGSLLRINIVITAASCIKDFQANDIAVKGGNINFKNMGQIRKINEIAIHPKFKADENSNNIALMRLRNSFNSNGNIEILNIPMEELMELPSAVSIFGWGISSLNTNKFLTKKIRVSKFKVYSHRKCLNYLQHSDRKEAEKVFCMGDRTKRVNICNDDIGSAAINVQYKTIYGIVSTNGACAENRTIIATSIAPHVLWIERIINEWTYGYNI